MELVPFFEARPLAEVVAEAPAVEVREEELRPYKHLRLWNSFVNGSVNG
jgi:hypothetical protein